MFKKNKGKGLQFANGVLLLSILIMIVLLLQNVIKELLPVGGDYSYFNLKTFLYNTFSMIWGLVVSLLTLLLINEKFDLFNVRFIRSRKILNFIFLFVSVLMVILLGDHLFAVVFNQFVDNYELISRIAYGLSFGTGLILISKYNVLTKDNPNGLNLLNFIFIIVSTSAFGGMINSLLELFLNTNVIDVTRNSLLYFITGIVFIVAVVIINKNKLNKKND